MSEDNGQKLDIDWLKTIAGALAAVSSAVLLSTLGAAGTLIGAALGSVIATVGSALYTQGLATSREQLARAQSVARSKVGIAQAEVLRAHRMQGDDQAVDAHLAHAEQQLDGAQEDLESLTDHQEQPALGARVAALPWRRILLPAAGIFAAALLAITAFELTTGEPVSALTGGTDDGDGTTISRIGGGSDRQEQDDEPANQDDEPGRPTDAPATEPSTEGLPTDEPSGGATVEPSEDTTPAPTEPPTSVPALPSDTVEPSAPQPSTG